MVVRGVLGFFSINRGATPRGDVGADHLTFLRTESSVDSGPAALRFQDPQVVIDVFRQASQANQESVLRRGSTVHLPMQGRLLMTGDLHDHGLNLQRVIQLARLSESLDHHLILHEVIHGERWVAERDLSVLTLAQVAALKLQHPEQVHLLLSNHELAQLGGDGISKGGVNVVEMFNQGIDFLYESSAGAVRDAVHQYIRSLVLAVKCGNGLFASHSLPSEAQLEQFDPHVIDRQPTADDLRFGGAAYNLVWGRRQTPRVGWTLARQWGVDLFVIGHQPVEAGYKVLDDHVLILASNHDQGAALEVDLGRRYTMNELVKQIVPLASVRP